MAAEMMPIFWIWRAPFGRMESHSDGGEHVLVVASNTVGLFADKRWGLDHNAGTDQGF